MSKKYLLSKMASVFPNHTLRRFLYRRAGFKIGHGVKIGTGVLILANEFSIGDNSRLADRVFIGRLAGLKIGEFTEISTGVIIDGESSCSIGDNCFVGPYYNINAVEKVVIEDNVALGGAFGQLWTHGTWAEEFEGYKLNKKAPVTIKKNAWIGTRSVILPGITVGESAVIGAGSIVTADVKPKTLVFGSPAKPVRSEKDYRNKLSDADRKALIESIVTDFVNSLRSSYSVSRQSEGVWNLTSRSHSFDVVFDAPEKIRGIETVLITSETPATKPKDISWFDFETKACSKTGSVSETAFRNFTKHYLARFKSE